MIIMLSEDPCTKNNTFFSDECAPLEWAYNSHQDNAAFGYRDEYSFFV
jgi:hypothetical protein